jgi:AraC-like DNA-binding protein
MSRATRIRVGWAFDVVALCQRAALRAHTSDPGAFVEAFEVLANELTAADGGAERVFLADRLREVTGRATRHWNAQPGNGQQDRMEILTEDTWSSGPVLEDPRADLLEWLRRTNPGLRRRTHLSLGARAANQVDSMSSRSLNLDALAASVDCSRSVLTRNFRKVNGLSVGQYQRRRRLRKAIVLLSTTVWTVDCIARLVGYRSTNTFYVALRTLTPLTPSGIRNASAAVVRGLIEKGHSLSPRRRIRLIG